ncbi:hypothetical protein [Helicobacter pullorum]
MLEKTMIKTLAKHYKGGDFCIEFWDKERVCFGEGEPKFYIKIHKKLPLNFINPKLK